MNIIYFQENEQGYACIVIHFLGPCKGYAIIGYGNTKEKALNEAVRIEDTFL